MSQPVNPSLASLVYYNDDPIESSVESFYVEREERRHHPAVRTSSLASINTTTSLKDILDEERRKFSQARAGEDLYPPGSLLSFLDHSRDRHHGFVPATSPFQMAGSNGGTPRSASSAVSLSGHHRPVLHHPPRHTAPSSTKRDMVRTPRSGTPLSTRAGAPAFYQHDAIADISEQSSSTSKLGLRIGGNAAVTGRLENIRAQLNRYTEQNVERSERSAFVANTRIDSLCDCCEQLSKMLTIEAAHRSQTETFVVSKLEHLVGTRIMGEEEGPFKSVGLRVATELSRIEESISLLDRRADTVQKDMDDFTSISISSEQERSLSKRNFQNRLADLYREAGTISENRIAYEVKFVTDFHEETRTFQSRVDGEMAAREGVVGRLGLIVDNLSRSSLIPGTRVATPTDVRRATGVVAGEEAPELIGATAITITDVKDITRRLRELLEQDSYLRKEGQGAIRAALSSFAHSLQ